MFSEKILKKWMMQIYAQTFKILIFGNFEKFKKKSQILWIQRFNRYRFGHFTANREPISRFFEVFLEEEIYEKWGKTTRRWGTRRADSREDDTWNWLTSDKRLIWNNKEKTFKKKLQFQKKRFSKKN